MRTVPRPEPAQTITVPEARALCAAAAIEGAVVRPQVTAAAPAGSWEIVLRMRGGLACGLRAHKGPAGSLRRFANVNTALGIVREIGVRQATVEFPEAAR